VEKLQFSAKHEYNKNRNLYVHYEKQQRK